VQFEWEDEPQTRAVRLVSGSARVHDPVRVTVAHVDAEGAHRGSWVFEAASARASSSPVACFGRCRRWNPTVCRIHTVNMLWSPVSLASNLPDGRRSSRQQT